MWNPAPKAGFFLSSSSPVMGLRLSIRPFRLLFKHPFETAHGTRDGTDSLFVRVEENGLYGYGETTLPPYVHETIHDAIACLKRIALLRSTTGSDLLNWLEQGGQDHILPPGCRAGLHMALLDLVGKQREMPVHELLNINGVKRPIALMTIGISPLDDIPLKIKELPESGGLKLKIGDPEATARIELVMSLDNRTLFLDGNQGLTSVAEALGLIKAVGTDRLLGMEQPFAIGNDALNEELHGSSAADIYGDESIQDLEDLNARRTVFNGVNLKLMKCGGLDKALAMAKQAKTIGLRIMVGSMSESSLGCTAAAHLKGLAEILDLDGPWLIRNDPFRGISMQKGEVQLKEAPGIGVSLKDPMEFEQLAHN